MRDYEKQGVEGGEREKGERMGERKTESEGVTEKEKRERERERENEKSGRERERLRGERGGKWKSGYSALR